MTLRAQDVNNNTGFLLAQTRLSSPSCHTALLSNSRQLSPVSWNSRETRGIPEGPLKSQRAHAKSLTNGTRSGITTIYHPGVFTEASGGRGALSGTPPPPGLTQSPPCK